MSSATIQRRSTKRSCALRLCSRALCLRGSSPTTFPTLACEDVFSLHEGDVIHIWLVVFYLLIIVLGGLANFGNMLYRLKNFMELFKEYTEGVQVDASAMSALVTDHRGPGRNEDEAKE